MHVIYRFWGVINNHQYKTSVTIHRAGQCPVCSDTILCVHIKTTVLSVFKHFYQYWTVITTLLL